MRKLCLILSLIFALQTSAYGAFFKKNDVKTETSNGYVGTLPNLKNNVTPEEPQKAMPVFDKTTTFHSENAIKPTPTDDPSFVNIILKQDKMSPYVSDLQEFIDMFEQILDSVENNEPNQRFASRVYYLNINTNYFMDKYEGRTESSYESYKKIVEISNRTKEISQLRADAEKYKRYLAYTDTGSIYSQNNIDKELDGLKIDIERAITVLKNTR